MGCGVAEQVFNLTFLVPLIPVAIYNAWDSITSFSVSTDIGSLSMTAGAISSTIAVVAFSALLMASCCKCSSNACILGVLCAIASAVDAVCYAAWCWYGTIGNVCSGASSISGKLNIPTFDCDKAWIDFLIWAWLGVSGSLQLSIAFSAVNCGSLRKSQSLRKPNRRQTRRQSSSSETSTSDEETMLYSTRQGQVDSKSDKAEETH